MKEQQEEAKKNIEFLNDFINEAIEIISECAPIIMAHNGAEHMLDGFSGRKDRPSDGLAKRINRILCRDL